MPRCDRKPSDAKDALRVIIRLVIYEVAMRLDAAPPTEDLVTVGPMTIDRLRHTVSVKGVVHHFKPREYALLEALARRPGIVSSRERLLDIAWPDDKDVADRTVDVHVARIRRKIGRSVKIWTVPGSGYTLDKPKSWATEGPWLTNPGLFASSVKCDASR